jgi:hypothetical protein
VPKKNGPGQIGLDKEAAACGFYRTPVEGYPTPRWAITCTDCETVSHHGWPLPECHVARAGGSANLSARN